MSNKVNDMHKVPPDGGYGWVVVCAYALNNVIVLPLITNFGLVFQEAFDDTNLTATQGNLVIVLNHSIGMLLTFFGGPLLRRFGYRKVAASGAIFISAGLILTAAASSFWMFILSYSIINSMGIAAVMAAFTLAINSFFKEKRSRAIGVAMSLTGLGAIGTPQVIRALMHAYGWRYAVLILSAICLHSLLSACLLRPAKWYLKAPENVEEMVPLNKENDVQFINGSVTASSKAGLTSLSEIEPPISNGVHPAKSLSMRSLTSNSSLKTRNAISHPDIRNRNIETPIAETRYKWWESQEINLGSSINIFNDSEVSKKVKEVEFANEKQEIKKSYTKKFIDFFDLTLLTDPLFVNILVGLSVAACVDTNFSLILPFILKDMMKFEAAEIANILSVIGLSDTLFRFVAPFIGEWCNKTPRVMYMVSLLMVVFIRSMMLFTDSFLGMCFVAFALGITKGIRTVYSNVIIPTYVPIERLPFAAGIQQFCNGITIVTIGSLLGRLRETSGSYTVPIIVMNFVSLITVIIWNAEFLFFKVKNRGKPEQGETART